MDELRAKLFRLFKDELDSLAIGRPYNLERIREINDICHLLVFLGSSYEYVDMKNRDIIKIINLFKQ